MAVFQRVVRDGITVETETWFGAPRSPRDIRKHQDAVYALARRSAQLSTFDGRVNALEAYCHRHDVSGEPAFGSQPWYTARILSVIRAVRDAQARGDFELALSEAVEVGALAVEAHAKFGPWPALLLRDARRQKNRELGRRGAAAVRAKAAEHDADIRQHATSYRDRHGPVTREHSTRAMANWIAERLDLKPGTVRDRLRRLKLR